MNGAIQDHVFVLIAQGKKVWHTRFSRLRTKIFQEIWFGIW